MLAPPLRRDALMLQRKIKCRMNHVPNFRGVTVVHCPAERIT